MINYVIAITQSHKESILTLRDFVNECHIKATPNYDKYYVEVASTRFYAVPNYKYEEWSKGRTYYMDGDLYHSGYKCKIPRHKKYFEKWFCKGTKVISLINYKEPWVAYNNPPMWGIHTNGARRDNFDKCFDLTINLGYLVLNYTNYDLQNERKKK